MRAMECACS
jgi:inorganic pyrophosphatase